MARPLKEGLSYFPLDVDFWTDPKLSYVIARYGFEAEAIAIRLLASIYRNGYYLPWGEEDVQTFVATLPDGVDEERVNEIVLALMRRGMFDLKAFKEDGILTSKGIQRRYFTASTRRKKDILEMPFVYEEVQNEFKKPEKESGIIAAETDLNGVNVDNNGVNVDNNQVNVGNNLFSRETKLNKTKLKKTTSPQSPPQGVRDFSSDITQNIINNVRQDPNRRYDQLLQSLNVYSQITSGQRSQIIYLTDYGNKDSPIWTMFPIPPTEKNPGEYIIRRLTSEHKQAKTT